VRAAPARPAEASVTIELPLGEQSVTVKWPTPDPERCARFVRPWARPVIRIDSVWIATEPMAIRAGTKIALARVVAVFGAAKPHCTYLFANRRADRMNVLVHDCVGIWLARGGREPDPAVGTWALELAVCRVTAQQQTSGGNHEPDPVGADKWA